MEALKSRPCTDKGLKDFWNNPNSTQKLKVKVVHQKKKMKEYFKIQRYVG